MDRARVAPDYSVPREWTDRVAATLPRGTGAVVVDVDPNATPLYRTTVTIRWTLPGDVQHKFVSVAQINGAGPL